MKHFFVLAALACVTALAPVVSGQTALRPATVSDWNITDHTPFDQIIIQGHRGVGDLAEENTIEAFVLAWKMGIYPECDLRMTKDGVIVPFHDDNFARVVKGAAPELKKKGVKVLPTRSFPNSTLAPGRANSSKAGTSSR